MKPTSLSAISFALLAGCASTSPLVSGIQTVEVPRIVVQRCVKASDIPSVPTPPAIADDADIVQRAAWARLRDAQLRQYVLQLRAALLACATTEVSP
jgi:hypothetical protein